VKSDNDTVKYTFDLRLFGIVLAKMLLFGDDVENTELYDWKTDLITANLECSFQPYKQLIVLCFDSDATSKLLTVFTISMISHINNQSPPFFCQSTNAHPLLNKYLSSDKSQDLDYTLEHFSFDSLFAAFSKWKQEKKLKEISDSSSPLLRVISEIKGYLKSSGNQDGENLLQILESISNFPEDPKHFAKLLQFVKNPMVDFHFRGFAMQAFGCLEKKDERVVTLLKRQLHTSNEWLQISAIEALLRFELIEDSIFQLATQIMEYHGDDEQMIQTVTCRTLPLLAKFTEL